MALKAKVLGRDAVLGRLRKLVPDAEEQVAKAQQDAAKELAQAIKARAPRLSGEYVDSIEAGLLRGRNDGRAPIGIQQTKDPNAWGIFALYVWRFIEFGTRAHTIKAKRKPLLAIRGPGGKVAFAKQVTHPGMRPQPHIFPTFRAMRKRIRRKVATSVNKAIRKAQG